MQQNPQNLVKITYLMLEMRKIYIEMCSQLFLIQNKWGYSVLSYSVLNHAFLQRRKKRAADKSGTYFCLRRDFKSVVLGKVVEVQLCPEEETRPQGQPSYLLPPLIKFRATPIYLCSASTY